MQCIHVNELFYTHTHARVLAIVDMIQENPQKISFIVVRCHEIIIFVIFVSIADIKKMLIFAVAVPPLLCAILL